MKKPAKKETLLAKEKAALRQRVRDIAVGSAGYDFDKEGEFATAEFLERFVCAMKVTFGTDAFARLHGIEVVWVEAKVTPKKGGGTAHRVVTFKTASRNGEPFEDVIEKYGIPNPKFFHCTRELKLNAIKSYLNYIGWFSDTYDMAVGIRADEMDRQSPRSMDAGVFYPLIDLGVNKADVLDWDLKQGVRLGIPEHMGNCVWCWKKSFRKLATVALEMPRAFEFPARMERFYADHGAGNGNRRFFRGQRLTSDIFDMASDPNFKPFVDSFRYADDVMDEDMACGDGCEIGVDGPGEVEPLVPVLDGAQSSASERGTTNG